MNLDLIKNFKVPEPDPLVKKIADAQSTNKEAEAVLAELYSKGARLNASIEASTREVEDLEMRLASSEEQRQKLSDLLESKEKEKEVIMESLAVAKSNLEGLREEVDSLSVQHRLLEKKNGEVTDLLAQARETHKSLIQESSELASILNSSAKTKLELVTQQAALATLQEQLTNSKTDYERLRKELARTESGRESLRILEQGDPDKLEERKRLLSRPASGRPLELRDLRHALSGVVSEHNDSVVRRRPSSPQPSTSSGVTGAVIPKRQRTSSPSSSIAQSGIRRKPVCNWFVKLVSCGQNSLCKTEFCCVLFSSEFKSLLVS